MNRKLPDDPPGGSSGDRSGLARNVLRDVGRACDRGTREWREIAAEAVLERSERKAILRCVRQGAMMRRPSFRRAGRPPHFGASIIYVDAKAHIVGKHPVTDADPATRAG